MEKRETSVCIWKAEIGKTERQTTTAARYCDANSILFVFIMALRCFCLPFCNNEDTRLILLHSNAVSCCYAESVQSDLTERSMGVEELLKLCRAAIDTLSLQQSEKQTES